ncbi:hypothetical protein DEJ28_15135 [Curtobacterium sp. MCPF17_002]|uniref:hypothetical protein n=1 Tax=Curtobacterium sp. MCPF17_002 TaxID=2175645 RepID=UPI000DA8DC0C|nr:hypothetical protein [Curtobacterium sp. MCPF17_002]WIB76971.1 hypothetical protein DEJ28_15135 [Curtobacterium sp. MCPF17_002]
MSAGRPTLMWEAAASPSQGDDLVAWVREVALPELGSADARLFRSNDDRVVVIASVDGPDRPRIAADPGDLVRRPPHQWWFDEVS